MKKLTMSGFAGVAAAAILAVVGFAPSANAQLITLSAGNFTIFANGFSADTLTPASPAPGRLATSDGPLEDTWGIFQITSILSGASPVFTDNLGTEYWGILYNSHDIATTTVAGVSVFTAQGLKLDVYKRSILDTGDAAWSTVYNQGPTGVGARLGIAGYNGISNVGSLVFSSALTGPMTSTFVAASGGTSATGNLGISFNNLFDTGGLTITDLSFTIGGLTSNVPAGWSVKFGGPIDGSVVPVPEPSTYGLIAAGALLGLVAFRRMKVRAQAV
jgi:PEP-CTERM motif